MSALLRTPMALHFRDLLPPAILSVLQVRFRSPPRRSSASLAYAALRVRGPRNCSTLDALATGFMNDPG